MELIGIAIGFYSYIMIGSINLAIVELHHKQKTFYLWIFLCFAIIFETIYCVISLGFLLYLEEHANILYYIKYLTFILLVILSIWSWFSPQKKIIQLDKNIIQRGIVNMIIHPQQIPFWIFWGAICFQKQWILQSNSSILKFAFYNAIGTFIILVLYAVIGKKLLDYLKIQVNKTNKIMAVFYLFIAIYLLF